MDSQVSGQQTKKYGCHIKDRSGCRHVTDSDGKNCICGKDENTAEIHFIRENADENTADECSDQCVGHVAGDAKNDAVTTENTEDKTDNGDDGTDDPVAEKAFNQCENAGCNKNNVGKFRRNRGRKKVLYDQIHNNTSDFYVLDVF